MSSRWITSLLVAPWVAGAACGEDDAEHETEPDADADHETEPDHETEVETEPDHEVVPGCPTTIIQVAEGTEVVPLTRLHLVGSQSAGDPTIARWTWGVAQPSGATSVFLPTATTPDPTFEVNVVGRYTFTLDVVDLEGDAACVPAEAVVDAVPADPLHIELVWSTPGDADPIDDGPEAGADLDLHVLHPLAVGGGDVDGDGEADGWFDLTYDTFWFNDAPNAGGPRAPMPVLRRDDGDGAGPEVVTHAAPEALCYRVGVHSWDDHGFGPSEATVRIYLGGALALESTATLRMLDMWSVARVCFPDAGAPPRVEPVTVCADTLAPCASAADCGGASCGSKIVPDYHQTFLP
ncbi:MAG: hypothetical protein IT385_29105 [Deltaproteobacteria bacterium]|nr:hypothetical protein [Deltaproteobacteria bacterium]